MLRKIVAFAGSASLALSLSACSETATPKGSTLAVSASFYPLVYLTEKIGGEYVTVSPITPSDVEPHDYELSPKEVATLEKSDLIIYTEGFQPALDEAVEQLSSPTILELSTHVNLHARAAEEAGDHEGDDHEDNHEHDHEDSHEHDHGAYDPHFWLDPQRMISAAQAISSELSQADSAHATDYAQNLEALTTELATLDDEFAATLDTCQHRDIVTTHDAFGYLAKAYGLTTLPISLDAESEPSPARLKELSTEIKTSGATTIFAEERASTRSTDALAHESGAQVSMLNPLEMKPETGDYTDAMRANLTSLRTGLSCE